MKADTVHSLLLDNLNTAVLVLGSELQPIYLNPAAEGILGVGLSRLRETSHIRELIDDLETVLLLENALESGNPFTQRKAELMLPDLRSIIVDYTVTPMIIKRSAVLLVEIQSLDRLMRINREEALLSAHDTSRNLVRGLAHEVKNPLGGIRGASQLLAAELSDQPELREYTDIITAETNRLCNLVDRLLGPTAPPHMQQVNIHEVLEHVAALIEAETSGQLPIHRDYDPSIPAIEGDREQLIQALLNIMRNAMQALQSHADPENLIVVRTRVQRHLTIGRHTHRIACRLDIIDNGPGIPSNIAERIFYPMISGRSDGTGLGLTIAQNVISLHQGLIECDSQPGVTQFTVYLPLEQQHD